LISKGSLKISRAEFIIGKEVVFLS